MTELTPAPPRFRHLPVAVLPDGAVVPVATSRRSRLLGLALLEADEAGPGVWATPDFILQDFATESEPVIAAGGDHAMLVADLRLG